jgi:Exostosin family
MAFRATKVPRVKPEHWFFGSLVVLFFGLLLAYHNSNSDSIVTLVNPLDSQPLGRKENEKDTDCPFRNSSLYRSIFVYPNPHTDAALFAKFRSKIFVATTTANTISTIQWPWILQRDKIRRDGTFLYNIDNPPLTQFALDLVVYEMMTSSQSCLRTDNPDNAKLFFVPFLPSVFRRGGDEPWSHDAVPHTSIYEQALADAMTAKSFDGWESVFGLTSVYWKRRHGTDHFVIMPEPLHGLFHPSGKRGFHHYIKSQKQLWAPIVISVEVSKTFVDTYPKCTRKNILVPYPNIDGRWYNGEWDRRAADLLPQQAPQRQPTVISNGNNKRPLWLYYNAGNHGECRTLRQALEKDYVCEQQEQQRDSKKNALIMQELSSRDRNESFPIGMRLATFCPCPGGDSPSAKRMFDAVLAGCIPIILSEDFVWPFASEEQKNTTVHQRSIKALNPSDFALRLDARQFLEPLYHTSRQANGTMVCQRKNSHENQHKSLSEYVRQTVSEKQIAALQEGMLEAAKEYSYFEFSATSRNNPLQEGIVPSGGAAKRIVSELEHRSVMGSEYWIACQEEKAAVLKRMGGKMEKENKC